MTTSFDWVLLNQERWTPLSTFDLRTQKISDRLYALAPCVFAIVNPSFGSNEDPGVGAILWAASSSIAVAIHTQRQLPLQMSSDCAPLPRELVGFEPLTFGSAMEYEKNCGGDGPQTSASYELQRGKFISSEMRTIDREYVFGNPNPSENDQVLAISFNLPQAE